MGRGISILGWRAGALIGVGSCGSPITNQVLLEDLAFLDALPSADRGSPPSAVLDAPIGDSPVLASARQAARALGEITDPIVTASEAVRAAVPDDRGEALRSWDAVSVVDETEDGVFLYWVKAEILRTDENGDFVWAFEAAPESTGRWSPLGEGRHDPTGVGTYEWDLAAHATLIGRETTGTLQVAYDDAGAEGAGATELVVPGGFFGTDQLWTRAGEVAFGYTGSVTITADGLPWPAVVQIVHVPETGGRAVGSLYKSESEEVSFESCWNAASDTTWLAGDADVAGEGSEGSCQLAPLVR